MTEKKLINFKLAPKIDDLLKKAAKTLGFNRSEYIRVLIQRDLEDLGIIDEEIKKGLTLGENKENER